MIAHHVARSPLASKLALKVAALVLVALGAAAFAMQSSLLRISSSDGEIILPTPDHLTVPIYPGAKRVESGSSDTYTFTTADAPLDVFTYYGTNLHDRGWITEVQIDRLIKYFWSAGPTAPYKAVVTLDAYGGASPRPDRTRFSIQIGLQPNPNGIPVYKSIGEPSVRDMWGVEESAGVVIDIPQRQITYLTGETPGAIYDIYHEKLPTYGWQLISDSRDSGGGLRLGSLEVGRVAIAARPNSEGPVEVTIQVRSQSMLENWDPDPVPTFTPVSTP